MRRLQQWSEFAAREHNPSLKFAYELMEVIRRAILREISASWIFLFPYYDEAFAFFSAL